MTLKAKIYKTVFKKISNISTIEKTNEMNNHLDNDCLINHKRRHFKIKTKYINGCECLVISNKKQADNIDKAVLYIHGGGFVLKITPFCWKYIFKLVKKTGATFYVPLYPLTTKEKTSVFDSIDIFIKLYKKIHKKFNKQIDLMGDSAGGNLILVLAQQLKLKKIHAPRNIIAISPVVNFNINLREIKHSLEKEAILPYSFIKLIQENYVGDLNPKLPIFSPLYGDCSYLAKKIWLFYGEDEGMSIDGEKFYSKAKHAGQKIFLNIKSEMFHIYPIFNIKEAKDTNKLIVDIIKFK